MDEELYYIQDPPPTAETLAIGGALTEMAIQRI